VKSPAAASLIHEARIRAGLSQRQLARRARTSQAVISAYENGKRDPGFAHMLELVRAKAQHGMPHYVHFSTDEVYGSISEGKVAEDAPPGAAGVRDEPLAVAVVQDAPREAAEVRDEPLAGAVVHPSRLTHRVMVPPPGPRVVPPGTV